LNDSYERFPDRSAVAAMKAQDVCIKIILEVFRFKTTLIGSPDQAFGHRRDQVRTVQTVLLLLVFL